MDRMSPTSEKNKKIVINIVNEFDSNYNDTGETTSRNQHK